jgi:hypothetical protein
MYFTPSSKHGTNGTDTATLRTPDGPRGTVMQITMVRMAGQPVTGAADWQGRLAG